MGDVDATSVESSLLCLYAAMRRENESITSRKEGGRTAESVGKGGGAEGGREMRCARTHIAEKEG